jgi:hypothetical protein
MPSFAFKYSNFPETKVPDSFNDLLAIGRKQADVEIFDRKWAIATLDQWELDEVNRKMVNIDVLTRSQLIKIEVLTCAIVKCTELKTSTEHSFAHDDEKPILRSLLLLLDPKIVNELYAAYQILEESARREFRDKYSEAIEKIRKDFFVLPGTSSKPSISKTPRTEDS